MNMRVGAKLQIGSFNVLSQCEKCKKYIWVRDFEFEPYNGREIPDTGDEPICVICAMKEVGILEAVNEDAITKMLLQGLEAMHEAGY